MPLVTTFFVTLTNCDSNVYNHIPYKHVQDCDYRQKTLQNNPFMLEYRCQLFKFPRQVILNSIMHY